MVDVQLPDRDSLRCADYTEAVSDVRGQRFGDEGALCAEVPRVWWLLPLAGVYTCLLTLC